jgi:hypothetical protein
MISVPGHSSNAGRLTKIGAAFLCLAVSASLAASQALAQGEVRRLTVKNGESIDLYAVYWTANCRSVMLGLPEIEVLEGPREVSLSVREEPVLPRRQGCANKIPGGTLMLTAKGVTEPMEAKLAYRVKYKTKDGERQTSQVYIVSLYP